MDRVYNVAFKSDAIIQIIFDNEENLKASGDHVNSANFYWPSCAMHNYQPGKTHTKFMWFFSWEPRIVNLNSFRSKNVRLSIYKVEILPISTLYRVMASCGYILPMKSPGILECHVEP